MRSATAPLKHGRRHRLVNLKNIARNRIDRFLASRGYALRRISLENSGWEEVLRRACSGVRENDPLVLDIGAHQGAFSELVLSRWPAAEVYAFEPIPEMAEYLTGLARRYPGLTHVPVALGAEEANGVEFNVHSSSASSSLLAVDSAYGRLYPDQARTIGSIRVNVRRMDDWAAESAVGSVRPIDLVKIDVQGYEDRVIMGGEATLRRARYLVTEAALYPSYAGGVMLDELCATLRGVGFELIWGFNVFGASADLFWRNCHLA